MVNEYSLLWRRLVTLAASCWGRWRGPHSLHCSGIKPIGCVHKFHHIAEQNVIGSARIACLCLSFVIIVRFLWNFLFSPSLFIYFISDAFSPLLWPKQNAAERYVERSQRIRVSSSHSVDFILENKMYDWKWTADCSLQFLWEKITCGFGYNDIYWIHATKNATERYIERSEPIELAVPNVLISHTRKSCTACGIVPVNLQSSHRQSSPWS